MSKKYVVWDLFGGGQNSVYRTIKEHHLEDYFEIYTFDVTEPTRHLHLKVDLARDDIIEVMREYPKPDIIVSSPLCQSFSCVLNMKGGGTCFWKYEDSSKTKIIERSIVEFEQLKGGFTKNLKADVQLFIKRLGEKCINNTIKLINHFQPKYWYIENPKHSLMWKYIKYNRSDFYKKHFHLNEASLGKYGFLTTKPTIFLSNIFLNLEKGKIPPPYTIEVINDKKYYVLKDDPSAKLECSLDSRMLGLASLKKMIKARNAKSGMGAMDFVMRSGKTINQKNKMVNEQLSEAGPASAIPHLLLKEIFMSFLSLLEKDDEIPEKTNLHISL